MAISLYHKELDQTIEVKTEAQAEVMKASGWRKATKKQAEKEGEEE